MSDKTQCQLCHWEANPPLAGGWLDQNMHWSVGVYPNRQVPGWVVVQLRRHAISLEEMTMDELASLGPTLARVSRAIRAETDAEKVYFVSFGEIHPHVHVMLMPRGSNIPTEHRSSALHINFRDYVDAEAAATVAQNLRRALSST
jgi:diadenosine tetraphosphate (Ap4A) HIT family hydrolase